MNCELPQAYVAALPGRIIEVRKAMLMAMMPVGVSGGGSDVWWDGGPVTHADGTTHQYSGNRWQAESVPSWGGVSVNETTRTVNVTFMVANTQSMTGEVYPCEQCQNGS